jgi:hypothetical protein
MRRLAWLAVGALCVADVAAQRSPETFTATATVEKGSARASAPVTVSITRYASEAERNTVKKAVQDGGTTGARKALSAMSDAGFIQLGDRRTPIKFAAERPTAGGRLVTILTATPILFLGAGIPGSKPEARFEVAIALLDLKDGQNGLGELAPAATIALDEGGAFVIEDYGEAVVWLNGLGPAR